MTHILFPVCRFACALLVSFIVWLTPYNSFADHVAGGTFYYEGIPGSPNLYHVTLKLYRDCSGIPYEIPVTVNISSTSGCGPDFNGSLSLQPGTGAGNEVITSAFPPCSLTTCAGGTGYGIEEWVYSDTLFIYTSCPDWNVNYTTCCRSP